MRAAQVTAVSSQFFICANVFTQTGFPITFCVTPRVILIFKTLKVPSDRSSMSQNVGCQVVNYIPSFKVDLSLLHTFLSPAENLHRFKKDCKIVHLHHCNTTSSHHMCDLSQFGGRTPVISDAFLRYESVTKSECCAARIIFYLCYIVGFIVTSDCCKRPLC